MENHQEDILKKFLQDTFSDYEPEPTEQSWENIFSAIQPNKPTFWGKSKPWIASVLVILTSVGVWYSSAKVEANALVSRRVGTLATNEKKTENLRLQNADRVLNPASVSQTKEESRPQKQSDDNSNPWSESSLTNLRQHSERKKVNGNTLVSEQVKALTTDNLLVNGRVETLTTDEKLASGRVETLATDEKKEAKIAKYLKEIIVKNNTPKEEVENHPTVEKQSDEVVISRDIFTVSTNEQVESVEKTTNESGRVETLTTEINNSNIEKVRYILPIESIKNKDVVLSKIVVSTPSVLPIISPAREAKPIRQHTYLSLSITPLQTYRILRINNRDVQNVQTNNLFDSERNGWQFEAGLVKPIGKFWNLRANFSYLKMRQWSEYQINTDELILRNTNTVQRSNILEALGQTITESKTLQMVGLKADVQRFFKITGRNRYFISTGTQLMYETQEKQTNVFINASAGFQHVVNKDLFLTIEPTASYLLYNINDSKSLIQTNAYNLGLKVGVNFRVK